MYRSWWLYLKPLANGFADRVALTKALSKLGQKTAWHNDEGLTGCELGFGLNVLLGKTV